MTEDIGKLANILANVLVNLDFTVVTDAIRILSAHLIEGMWTKPGGDRHGRKACLTLIPGELAAAFASKDMRTILAARRCPREAFGTPWLR